MDSGFSVGFIIKMFPAGLFEIKKEDLQRIFIFSQKALPEKYDSETFYKTCIKKKNLDVLKCVEPETEIHSHSHYEY